MRTKKHLITSALPYANGALHLGHLAGAYLPADIYARYLRLLGEDVLWVCGSDEHGAAITLRAKKEGIAPQEIIDKYHNLNKSTFEQLGISFDIYSRTSNQVHHEIAQNIFTEIYEKGDQFEVIDSEQYYDEKYNQFLADRYIKGTCPNCKAENAFGDQCESCGKDLSPIELINPLSTLSGDKPVMRKTKHWYFKLDKHEDWLKAFINEGKLDGKQHHNPSLWKNHVKGQCNSWLETGLLPRAITRDLDWGVKVPLKEAEGKVLYVWFDAPIGYISATKEWADKNGKNWEDYWKNEDTELVHFIGKDNIVFHCIVFPAMLKAHGGFNLPVNVPANQFLNFEGEKFSKSRGWGIEQQEYLTAFSSFENHVDALRYALIRNMPESKDADFKWDEFTDFHDNELVANFGNFVNRVVVLYNKYFDGKVSLPEDSFYDRHPAFFKLIEDLDQLIKSFNFRQAVVKLMELSSYGNTHLQDVSPWKIWKENPDSEEVAICMYDSLEIVNVLSILCLPFIPFTSDKLRNLINLPLVKNGDWSTLLTSLKEGKSSFQSNHQIGKPTLLFAKINDKKDTSRLEIINIQKEKLVQIMANAKLSAVPVKENISFDDFVKMDIRTATIISAEKVKKANKLLKLEVDLGFETRTVVSGIAKHFKADEVVGKTVTMIVNLAPRKIMGIESQGMILMAENADKNLIFISPEDAIKGMTVS